MALLLGILVATVACAGPRAPVRSLLEIRQANVIVQQWDASCGAAALATLLTYHFAEPVSEREVARGMLGKTDPLRVKVRGGFSLLDLKRYAEARGYQAEGYLGASLEELDALGPAIVPVILSGYPHFVVYKGRQGNRILLADPAYGNRSVEVDQFLRAWQKMAFVVERPGFVLPSLLGAELQDRLRPTRDMVRIATQR